MHDYVLFVSVHLLFLMIGIGLSKVWLWTQFWSQTGFIPVHFLPFPFLHVALFWLKMNVKLFFIYYSFLLFLDLSWPFWPSGFWQPDPGDGWSPLTLCDWSEWFCSLDIFTIDQNSASYTVVRTLPVVLWFPLAVQRRICAPCGFKGLVVVEFSSGFRLEVLMVVLLHCSVSLSDAQSNDLLLTLLLLNPTG